MGPVTSAFSIPEWLDLLMAFIIGTGFGFALEQAGFSSSRKLVGMFYGYDTIVLKVFFTAAIFALTGSQLLGYFGLLNLNQVYVNEFYPLAALTGGIIMGAGFIMGGFCPGTGLCAMSTGKIDAMVFIAGGLAGAFLFAETYPLIQGLADAGFKGAVRINDVFGLSQGMFSFLLITAAIFMFWLAEKAERKFAWPEITNEIQNS